MGNSHSATSALGSRDELLGRLAGPEPLDSSEAYWDQLLNIPVPLASLNPEDVEDAILPHCRQMRKSHNLQSVQHAGTSVNSHPWAPLLAVVHNPLTYNFQRLVLHALDLVGAAEKGNSSQAVANSLHMLAIMIKCTAATASPAALAGMFAVSAALPEAVQGQ